MSLYYAAMDGRSLADIVTDAETAERIILCGPYPEAAGLRRWLAAVPGTVHYARSDGRCLMTLADGRRVTSLAAWDLPPMTGGAAYGLMYCLAHLLRARFDCDTISLVSPATCGMSLFRHVCPNLPTLPPAVQDLIRGTSPQRREEPSLTLPDLTEIPEVQVWDGRFMYGALLRDLPGEFQGEVEFPRGRELGGEFRGRVYAEVAPPPDWQHVGLLPVPGRVGWEWPTTGEHSGWFEACELRFAIRHGWRVRPLHGLQFGGGDPLAPWAGRLLRLWAKWEAKNPLMGRCLRAIVLQTIGDFQGRSRTNERVFADARTGLDITREVPLEYRRSRAELAHPEWCAAIWGRCRVRVASWLLSVPRSAVLRVMTDAVYLTEGLPQARGGIGQPRLKGRIEGPLPAPHSKQDWAELLAGKG